jgi:hypothetical protein
MAFTSEYRESHREEIAAYHREYYRAHSKRPPRVAGADRQSKTCRKCGIEKSREDFTVRLTGPRAGHLVAHCKACAVARVKAYVDRDASVYRRVSWPSKLKRLYGISVDDYHRMLADQGGRCAICGSDDPYSRGYKRIADAKFCVDHCHVTKRVRGLLCTRCNRAVGLIGDNAANAARMTLYLSKEK